MHNRGVSRGGENRKAIPAIPAIAPKTGAGLFLRQWQALFKKRWLQWIRNYKLLFVLFVLPVILVIIGMAVVKGTKVEVNETARQFNLVTDYSRNTIWYSLVSKLHQPVQCVS